MKNEYIAPVLVGFMTPDLRSVPAIISPLYEHGNVFNYVRQYVGANKKQLARQVAMGLAYAHSCGIIHGNVCAVSLALFEHGCYT